MNLLHSASKSSFFFKVNASYSKSSKKTGPSAFNEEGSSARIKGMSKLDSVAFILVEPESAGNIGATCRAIKTMGISELILVNPKTELTAETVWMAHGSEDIIKNIKVELTLEEALKPFAIAVATTHRSRENQLPLFTPREIAELTIPFAQNKAPIAFVFGRESNGLTDEELSYCDMISTIPQAIQYPAINLSQAAMIYAHELHQASTPKAPYEWKLAKHKESDRFYEKLEALIEKLPIQTRHGNKAFAQLFRRVLGRTQLETRDVNLLLKFINLIEAKINT